MLMDAREMAGFSPDVPVLVQVSGPLRERLMVKVNEHRLEDF
jgi:hypothetical protein